MDGVKLLQIILIIIACGVIFYLLRLSNSVKLEKRLAKFAINTHSEEDEAVIDKLIRIIWVLVRKFSKVLEKSEVLRKLGERYNKYISYDERNERVGIDYISFKFLLAFFIVILSIVTMILHYIKLDFMIILVIFLISFFLPDIFLKFSFSRKRKRIEDDLLKAIIIMNNAFQSGRNIMQATECVKEELDGPIKDEFQKIYLDITYGLGLDVVFKRFYERVNLEDAQYITSSLTLLNKTGGDIVKVFSIIEKSIMERKNLKNELNSLTASSQFVFKLLIFLPFFLICVIMVFNPSYFKVLFTTPLGIIILILTILLYILYILTVKRVLEVEL